MFLTSGHSLPGFDNAAPCNVWKRKTAAFSSGFSDF